PDTGHVLRAVFRAALVEAAADGPVERDFAVLDRHLDAAGVEIPVVGQRIAHVLEDALVRTGIVGRAAAAVIHLPAARSVLVAEPARDLVARAVEKAALFIAVGITGMRFRIVSTGAIGGRHAAEPGAVSAIRPPVAGREIPACLIARGEARETAPFAGAVTRRAAARSRAGLLRAAPVLALLFAPTAFLHVGVAALAIVVAVAAAFAHLAGERFVVAILAIVGLPVAVGLELIGLRVVVLAVVAAAAPFAVTVARAVVVPVSHWSLLKFSGKLRRAAWGGRPRRPVA